MSIDHCFRFMLIEMLRFIWVLTQKFLSGQKMRFRYDKDLDAVVPVGNNYYESPRQGPHVIRDIEGYRTAAGDIANDGKRSYISSRSRHREFLRDNNYIEVGNDYDRRQVDDRQPRRQTKAEFQARQRDRVEHIKRAIDLVRTGRVREHFEC